MPWHPWEDLGALLELAAPSTCAGCHRPGYRWCPDCTHTLRTSVARPWRPTPCPAGMPPTWAGPAYEGVIRRAVVAWKEQDRVDITAALAGVLSRSIRAALAGCPGHCAKLDAGFPIVVVPAPSTRVGTRARGRFPMHELARRTVGSGAVAHVLRYHRPVADQAGLAAHERTANVAGALRVAPRFTPVLRGRPVLLVDDIVTSGATLVECHRALAEAGAGPVAAAVLAASVRRGSPDPADTRPLPPGRGAH